MTPKEILDTLEQQFGSKPVRKPTLEQIEAATKALENIEELYGE